MFQQSSDYISRPITTHGQIRRLPHQGARHGTVDHGDASDGVFLLLHLWVLPSRWAIFLRRSPSSLSSLWMASWCEWLSPCEWRCLQGLRVEDSSGARKGGPNRPRNWARPAGLGRPAQAHPGPARSPLLSRGSSCGLAEISNSKEETRGTQFRQVRAARCVIPYVLYAA
jgi:hypothetical protein